MADKEERKAGRKGRPTSADSEPHSRHRSAGCAEGLASATSAVVAANTAPVGCIPGSRTGGNWAAAARARGWCCRWADSIAAVRSIPRSRGTGCRRRCWTCFGRSWWLSSVGCCRRRRRRWRILRSRIVGHCCFPSSLLAGPVYRVRYRGGDLLMQYGVRTE